MDLEYIYANHIPGSDTFARLVVDHCGYDLSRSEAKAIGEFAGDAYTFQHVWENEAWWMDEGMKP